MLLNGDPFPCVESLKKGLVLELVKIKNSNDISWPLYTTWIQKIVGSSEPISVNALRKSILNVETQKGKLAKQVHRVGSIELDKFLSEAYTLPRSSQSQFRIKTVSQRKPQPVISSFDFKTLESVNKSLAAEVSGLKEEVATDKQQLVLKEKTIIEIRTQSRAIKKQVKRRDDKISKLLSIIDSLKHQKAPSIKQKHTKSLKNLVRYYKTKCNYLKHKLMYSECEECGELEHTVKTLQKEKLQLLEANAHLFDELKAHASNKVYFHNEGKYSDDLRICIMELLTHGVGILKVRPILQSVFKLLNVECDKLPERTTINEILIESRSIAHTQIAEALTTTTNNCLHSDGTTKFGHKYQSYQVTTKDGPLSLGLQVC